MRRLTVAQMRRTVGRLVAVGIAIALSAGFITATFLATATISATTYEAAGMMVADADVVVGTTEGSLTPEDLSAISDLDAVTALHPMDFETRVVASAAGSDVLAATAPAADPTLDRTSLLSGSPPTNPGQIALPETTAQRLEVELGDVVTTSRHITAGEVQPEQSMTVVGITADGSGLGFGIPIALASSPDVASWRSESGSPGYYGVLVALDGEASPDQVVTDISALLPQASAQTGHDYAEAQAQRFTGGVSVLLALVLSFAAVAIAVAGLVISNTFQVLITQRTHTLALLRCIGATRSQIRSSVRLEALLLGVVSSIAGILAGIGIGQLVIALLRRSNQGVPLPAVIPVNIWAVTVPLVVGTLVTVIAAGGAARAATRVAPLAALRPQEASDGAAHPRRQLRVVLGWVLVGLGCGALAGAVALTLLAGEAAYLGALGVGVLGGITLLVGVVMCSVSVVPAFVRGLGLISGGLGGAPGRLAAVNAVRNPTRTASTANALVVGVALVTMMAVGSSTARSALDGMLQSEFAIDVTVEMPSDAELTPETIAAVQSVDGIAASVVLPSVGSDIVVDGEDDWATIYHIEDIADFFAVVRGAPETWVRGYVYADGWITTGSMEVVGPGQGGITVTTGEAAEVGVGSLTAPALLLDGVPDRSVFVEYDMWPATGLTTTSSAIWFRLADDADPRAVVAAISDAVSDTSVGAATTPLVSGSAVERAGYAQIIDTLLLVVIGLLGVAVVIALLGVANTLSLSVLERRQENALLRALGLTRGQLRATLAWEGILLALLGALAGVVLGLALGWVGSYLLLSTPSGGGGIALVIPWPTMGAVLAVAVLAGVLASVLPARHAVKVPPVVALGA